MSVTRPGDNSNDGIIDNISCQNARFVEQRLNDYLRDPETVSQTWRQWFGQLDEKELGQSTRPASRRRRRSVFNPAVPRGTARQHLASTRLQDRVDQLVRAYRVRGHLAASLDPLGMAPTERRELSLDAHGLCKADLGRRCSTLTAGGDDSSTLGDVVRRFSQRHAVLHDIVDGARYEVFRHLTDDQATVEVVNSPLCEAGALGFEYGYSLGRPQALVAWEAQYGDFANAAQVVIDQFLASAEDKWRRLSGLVLLLPHGFEGMGPEHSSARLERFLSLAAEDNLQIACPSTPAQYFHLLRRQVKRRWRKPLVILTPKSLLRHRQAVSSLDELAAGRFRRILPDDSAAQASRVLLCSGKVYYDLLKHRQEHERSDVALIRVEQLYPLPNEAWNAALEPLRDGTPVVWVQEEPENMGAWRHWRVRFGDLICGRPLSVVARPRSASPATGSKASHKREQKELVARAFDSTASSRQQERR